MSLKQVSAVRYLSPLKEGGSLPGLIEGDDGALYVVKMRGAGQGPLALVAEVIVGHLGARLGLPVPEIAAVEQAHDFGRQERDPEIRDLLRASVGTNIGLRFLEGSTTFDPAAQDTAEGMAASLTVWLDAFVLNVDRTSRNPNLLRWRGETWLIDHGAALYFHHHWSTAEAKIAAPFAQIKEHVLLPWADDIDGAGVVARERLAGSAIAEAVDLVPESLLAGSLLTGDDESDGPVDAATARKRYKDFLGRRLVASFIFEEEVQRARSVLV